MLPWRGQIQKVFCDPMLLHRWPLLFWMNLAFSFRGPVGYIVGRKTGQDNVSRQVFTWRTGTSWRLVYQVWYCCASWLYVVAGCNFHSYVAIACCSSMILFAPLSYIVVLHCCTCTCPIIVPPHSSLAASR